MERTEQELVPKLKVVNSLLSSNHSLSKLPGSELNDLIKLSPLPKLHTSGLNLNHVNKFNVKDKGRITSVIQD